jgi:alcohol dehydrogenase
MRAQSLFLVGSEQLAWIAADLAEPGPDELLVETIAGAISIGTELPHYLGQSRGTNKTYPVMTGYESVARVLACGSNVTNVRPGDRIVAFYGHRTHAVIPATKALPVPGGVDDDVALLAILSCDVAKGIRKLRPAPDDRVLITGAGTIGLLTLWVLLRYGIHQVDVCEPQAKRRQLATRFGARAVFTPDEQDRNSDGYAYGFECSSRDAAFGLLQHKIRPDGSICILADGNLEPLTLRPEFHQKELHVVGSSDGWDYQDHARWFFEQLHEPSNDQPALLRQLFEWRIEASELPDAFERLAHDADRPIKVFVTFADTRGSTPPVRGYPRLGDGRCR